MVIFGRDSTITSLKRKAFKGTLVSKESNLLGGKKTTCAPVMEEKLTLMIRYWRKDGLMKISCKGRLIEIMNNTLYMIMLSNISAKFKTKRIWWYNH